VTKGGTKEGPSTFKEKEGPKKERVKGAGAFRCQRKLVFFYEGGR